MNNTQKTHTTLLRFGLAASVGVLLAGCGSMSHSSKSEEYISNAEIRDVVSRVAKHQIHPLADGDYPNPSSVEAVKSAKAPEGISWSYPWGVALYGMLASTDVTHDKAVDEFVVKHDQICARYYNWLSELRKAPNNSEFAGVIRSNKIRGLMNLGNLDSCGAMGNQFLEMMLRHPGQVTPEEKAVGERIADWILNKQRRESNGMLSRPTSGGTVWPDDLYMACPFIVRWAKISGEKKYLDDAAQQIIDQAEVEQDADGLFFHGYFLNRKEHAPFKWGRGNGWVTVATVEVLSALPENHPLHAKLVAILKKQIDGLKPLQAPDGMWRQVLDKPELWEETSCTAMFAYGIARAVNRGWLDNSYLPMARKAFAGLSKNVTAEGVVNETCQGTNIGETLDYYINRGRPSDDPHGRGPVMLAGTELLKAK